VLTRPMARHGTMLYQVYSDPLLLYDLSVEELTDGCVQTGSFKRVFTPTQPGMLNLRLMLTIILLYDELRHNTYKSYNNTNEPANQRTF